MALYASTAGIDCSSTDATWVNWCSASGGTATDLYTTSNGEEIWGYWCGTSGTSTSTSATVTYSEQDAVWEVWNIETSESERSEYVPPKFTTEEKRAQRAQRLIDSSWAAVVRKEREEERKVAEATAQELLEVLIGKTELDVYNETGRLLVKGKKFDYLVKKRGGVTRIERDKVVDMCVHLFNQYRFPVTDNTITLKLMIEGGHEDEVLSKANDSRPRTRPLQLPRAACG